MINHHSTPDPVTVAEEHVHGLAVPMTRLYHRRRRLLRALSDLGLLEVVGADWCRLGTEGIAFGELTAAQSDRFLRLLEDLAAEHQPPVIEPGEGQLSLDLGDSPAGGHPFSVEVAS